MKFSEFMQLLAECQEILFPEQYPMTKYTEKYGFTKEDNERASTIIYIVKNSKFPAIVRASGLTQPSFAEAYGIPLEMVEVWCSGRRRPPDYIVRFIGWILISEMGAQPKYCTCEDCEKYRLNSENSVQ